MFITVYRGTNIKDGINMLKGEFNNITWWTDNYETVNHYYEGCVISLTIKLNEDERMSYICEPTNESDYTFGYSEMLYPKGAKWYSISSNYISQHKIYLTEIELYELKNKLNN